MSGLLPVKAESTQEQDIIDVESTSTETSGSDSCTTNGHSLLVKNIYSMCFWTLKLAHF